MKWKLICQNVGFHGWKYMVIEHSAYFRFGWTLICFTAIVLSMALAIKEGLRIRDNSIITLPQTTQRPNMFYYFPSVTICSFNKISKRAAYKMASELKSTNGTNVELLTKSLKLLASFANNKTGLLPEKKYNLLRDVLQKNHLIESEVFETIAPSCGQLLKKCKWKGKAVSCGQMFKSENTPSGVCCSSSAFSLRPLFGAWHWTPGTNKFMYNSGCSLETGLEILLDNDPADYFVTSIPSIGFQIQLHNPFDFPHFAIPTVLAEINTNNFISISPQLTYTVDDIKSSADSERGCLRSQDRPLDIFFRYTYQNCMTECKIALILERCGCVPFYFGKGPYNRRDKCTLKAQGCIARHQGLILTKLQQGRYNAKTIAKCNCPVNCAHLSYIPHVSKGPLHAERFTKSHSIEYGMNLENHTIIRVFYSKLVGTSNKRVQQFPWTVLLGFYGGLLGLFTAFSFIRVSEIIYFSGLRGAKKIHSEAAPKYRHIEVSVLRQIFADISEKN